MQGIAVMADWSLQDMQGIICACRLACLLALLLSMLALHACLLLVPSWDGGGTVATILILEAFGYGVADWLAGDVQ